MLLLTKKKYAARVVVERPDGQYTTYREAKGYFSKFYINIYIFLSFPLQSSFSFFIDDDSNRILDYHEGIKYFSDSEITATIIFFFFDQTSPPLHMSFLLMSDRS